MKKAIIFSILFAVAFVQVGNLLAGNPHGHKYYMKHNKHHKAHKMHHPNGIIDATYN